MAIPDRGRYRGHHGCNDCHTPFKIAARTGARHGALPLRPSRRHGAPSPRSPARAGSGGAATNTRLFEPWGSRTPQHHVRRDRHARDRANFVKALREGKHLGVGRPINPPMPWPAYRLATEADLEAVYAFLKTVPPVKNQAPEAPMAPPPSAPPPPHPPRKSRPEVHANPRRDATGNLRNRRSPGRSDVTCRLRRVLQVLARAEIAVGARPGSPS
jgi:hypothetical protein